MSNEEQTAAQPDERAPFRGWWDVEYGCKFDEVPGVMGAAFREVAEKAWQAARTAAPQK